MVVFLSSGTWTCPTGVTVIYVTGFGGGSGGGGGGSISYNETAYGGGGGQAAVLLATIPLPVTAGDIYNVVIGSGGVGGTGGAIADGAAGGAGENTYFKDPSNNILLTFAGQSIGGSGSASNPTSSNGSNSQPPTLAYYIGGSEGISGNKGAITNNAGSGGAAGPNGNGGNGGGGQGSGSSKNGIAAAANSGAGGGGGGAGYDVTFQISGDGAAGGSGLLIISYGVETNFSAGGDLAGNNVSQTVVGLQTIPISTTTPTANQVLEYNSGSGQWTPTNSASAITWADDLAGSTNTAQHVSALAGLTLDITPALPSQDGYALTYSHVSDSLILANVGTGTSILGGDLSGNTASATVIGLQGIRLNIDPLANNSPSIIQYNTNGDGYWTSQGAPLPVIYGQNPLDSTWSSSLDDAPIVQAFLNANPGLGYLTIVNPVFKTPVNFGVLSEPVSGSASRPQINFLGGIRVAMNIAELEVPGGVAMNGLGGSAVGSGWSAPAAHIQQVNSHGVGFQPEPTMMSSDGYIDGYNGTNAGFLAYDLENVIFPAPLTNSGIESLIGQTFTIVSYGVVDYVTNTPVGNYILAAIVSQVPYKPTNTVYTCRLVWQGNYSVPPSCIVSGVTWSCGSYINQYNADTFLEAGGNSTDHYYAVYNCAGLDLVNCWKHWMSTTNSSNTYFNMKLWRMTGALNSTTAFVQANQVIAGYSPTLPDYGIGGSSGSPKINTYEANPVISFRGDNSTVSNITLAAGIQSPGFVFDGAGSHVSSANFCVLENCGSTDPVDSGTCYVPIIVNGSYWFNINYFEGFIDNFESSFPNVCCASILFTNTTTIGGSYTGLGYINHFECSHYGMLFISEGGLPISGIQFNDFICEEIQNYRNQSWAAVAVIERAGEVVGPLSFHNTTFADAIGGTGPIYTIEGVVPVQVPGTTFHNDTITGEMPFYLMGPNLSSYGSDILCDSTPFYGTTTYPWSGRFSGMSDSIEIGGNDQFAPTITLPYALPMPPLLTVANWQALPVLQGTPTFSNSGADGYTLFGPDLSTGKVIQITSPHLNDIVRIGQWTIASPQPGDQIMIYMRLQTNTSNNMVSNQHTNFGIFPSGGSLVINASTNAIPVFTENGYGFAQSLRPGGMWMDFLSVANVISASGATTLSLEMSGGLAPIIVDPESIAVLYIPANSTALGLEAFNSLELQRVYRKIRTQITNATPGDVAIPQRNGLSFGGAARLGTVSLNTASTSATTIYSFTVPNTTAFNVSADWTAIVDGYISSGYVSGGSFNIVGYADASGTVTVSSVNTFGTAYNVGAGGAAASTPISTSASTHTVNIKVNAEYIYSTDWQLTLTKTSVS